MLQKPREKEVKCSGFGLLKNRLIMAVKGLKISVAIALLSALIMSCCVSCSPEQKEYVRVEGAMLGTFIQVSAQTSRPASEIYDLMMQIDAEAKASMSIFDEESLLSRINRGETDSLDKHIIFNLTLAERVYHESEGIYDVTVKPLVEAYGFAGKNPSAKINLDSIMEFVGFDKIQVKDGLLIRADRRVQLDFNSIAKGYTVDLAAEALESLGIENYMVDIGGEVRCRGLNSKGGAWRVGVETPFDGNDTPGAFIQQVISLTDCSMATSGNYRRYYVDNEGRKIAHTINPRTGESVVSELLSATVVAPTAAEADAYGTMFLAMGKERAIEVAKRLAKSGIMVYFIASGADDFEVYYSEGLAPALKQTSGFNAI